MFSEADITAFLVPRLERAMPGRLIAIYVFGSFARGGLRADSDVDIAFLHERKFDPVDVFTIAQELASAIHRDVDLVDLRGATTVLRGQVIGEGRAIYVDDENERGRFEMYSLSAYARFNEERGEVRESLAARYRG